MHRAAHGSSLCDWQLLVFNGLSLSPQPPLLCEQKGEASFFLTNFPDCGLEHAFLVKFFSTYHSCLSCRASIFHLPLNLIPGGSRYLAAQHIYEKAHTCGINTRLLLGNPNDPSLTNVVSFSSGVQSQGRYLQISGDQSQRFDH